MSLVDYPLFSWVVVIHSLHVSSFLEAHHQEIIFPVQSASGIVVQGKWSPDDELPESSEHVESEWRLPMKIKDSPQVTSCWLFLNNYNDARNNECKMYVFIDCIFWTDHITLYEIDLPYLCIIITNYYAIYFIIEAHFVLCLLLFMTSSVPTLVDLLNTK